MNWFIGYVSDSLRKLIEDITGSTLSVSVQQRHATLFYEKSIKPWLNGFLVLCIFTRTPGFCT